MSLENRLEHPLSHNYYYREVKGSNSIRRLATSKDSPKQYVVDNCVLTNSVNVIKEISNFIDLKQGFIKNIDHLMKCVYGQVKYLNKLAQNNQIITTPEIVNEFRKSYKMFHKEYDKLQHSLEESDYDSPYIHKYQELVAEQMYKLNDIVPYCQFEDSNIIREMKRDFKKTPFYVKTIPFKKGEKNISENDLGILMLANYQNSDYVTRFCETILLSNDKDLLAQGPVRIRGELFKSPEILSSSIDREYGTQFQFRFCKHRQPEIRYDEYSILMKKHVA